MLTVRAARKVFHRGRADERTGLDGLDLELASHDFCVVIGSNGAGKSTLLGAVAGSVSLDSGAIVINGVDLTERPVHKRAAQIARVFQDPMRGTAASMTVAENLLLADLRGRKKTLGRGVTARRRKQYCAELARFGLGLEERLDTRVDLLSGGQRQSLSLIMAVATEPDLLLLDEHTAALDPRTADIVMEATVRSIREKRLTALMVTHNMQHAINYGNRIVMMEHGRIIRGLTGPAKSSATVADLIGYFAVKSDRMLLSS